MPKFRFKFHQCDGSVAEFDGSVELPDLASVRQHAVGRAREIMAKEVKEGRLCLSCWIVASDEQGHNVMTLHFGDAIALTDANHCDGANNALPHDLFRPQA